MGYHAKLSPSSAHRWTSCTASIDAQEGIPNQNSPASMQGTCGHQMGAECLEDPTLDPQDYLKRRMLFWAHAAAQTNGEDWQEAFLVDDLVDELGLPVIEHVAPLQTYEVLGLEMQDSGVFTGEVVVEQELVDAVVKYVDFIHERQALLGAELHVEQRVPIGHFTGEVGATGTSDAIMIYRNTDDDGYTIESDDAKFGRHKVHAYEKIEPERGDKPPVMQMNLQIASYVLGALEKYGAGRKITRCKGVIVQPFLNHVSEYECSIEELLALRDGFLAVKAEETRTFPVYKPSYDNCHFCKARNPEDPRKRCKARDEAVIHLVLEGFGDAGEPILKPPPPNDQLGALYGALDFVRSWCDDIAIRVKSELTAGRPVQRPDGLKYRLVQGRKGDRKWDDPDQVEAMLKHMRLRVEQMYSMRIITPAAAEKLAYVPKRKKDAPPPTLNTLQWKKLQARITQDEGGMSVALETDTRPELPSKADGFVDVESDEDCSDLL